MIKHEVVIREGRDSTSVALTFRPELFHGQDVLMDLLTEFDSNICRSRGRAKWIELAEILRPFMDRWVCRKPCDPYQLVSAVLFNMCAITLNALPLHPSSILHSTSKP